MTQRQAYLRSRAASDINETIANLRSDAGDAVALAFITTLESGVNRITRSPNVGSLRFAFEVGIPELRAWRLGRIPFVIFYVPLDDRVDIWRILHNPRDIPASFSRGE